MGHRAVVGSPEQGADHRSAGNEYLIWLEPDLTLTPQLAAAWEAERDGARWVVTLREASPSAMAHRSMPRPHLPLRHLLPPAYLPPIWGLPSYRWMTSRRYL